MWTRGVSVQGEHVVMSTCEHVHRERAGGVDAAALRFVRTVAKRGLYSFIAEVTAEDAAERNPQAYQHHMTGWCARIQGLRQAPPQRRPLPASPTALRA